MTSRQNNKLNMYLAVYAFLSSKIEMLANLPRFTELLAALFSGINQIKLLDKEQMFDKSGINKNKKSLKHALASLAADTSRKLMAFAKFSNNQLLLSEISFTESKLKYANSIELRKYAQGIFDRAQTYITELVNYGITPETQTVLGDAISAFSEFIPQPRIVKATGKRYTSEIVDVIKNTDSTLADMDTCIEIIKLKEANLYKEYKSVRKIILSGKGSIALRGQITDAITKEPLKNVIIEFHLKENGSIKASGINGAIVRKSANKGGFFIKTLPNGIYNVEIRKNGYAGQKTTVAVTNGEIVKLDVELVKGEE